MSDDQRSGMEPDEAAKFRPFTEGGPDDPGTTDAEGHAAKAGRATGNQQPDDMGSGMEPDEAGKFRGYTEGGPAEPGADVEGHVYRPGYPTEDKQQANQRSGMEPDEGSRVKGYTEGDEPNVEGHAVRGRPAQESGPDDPSTEQSDEDDLEGHRAFRYSDRNMKLDITPVVW